MEERSKISIVESFFLVLLLTGPVDIADMFLGSAGLNVLLTGPKSFSWLAQTYYFLIKGGGSHRLAKKLALLFFIFLLELVLGLNMLPFSTFVLILVIRAWNKEIDLEEVQKEDSMSLAEKKTAAFMKDILSRIRS